MDGCLAIYAVDGKTRRTEITGESLARSGGDAAAWLPAGATDVTIYTGADADRERERLAAAAAGTEVIAAIDSELRRLDRASLRPLGALFGGQATEEDGERLRGIETAKTALRTARRGQ